MRDAQMRQLLDCPHDGYRCPVRNRITYPVRSIRFLASIIVIVAAFGMRRHDDFDLNATASKLMKQSRQRHAVESDPFENSRPLVCSTDGSWPIVIDEDGDAPNERPRNRFIGDCNAAANATLPRDLKGSVLESGACEGPERGCLNFGAHQSKYVVRGCR